MQLKNIVAAGLVAAPVLGSTATVRACPLCKDGTAVSESASGATVTDAAAVNFNTSIYGLLGGVTIVTSVAGTAIAKAIKAG